MFHSIVVATDFSHCAERAVRVAAAWAQHQHATLEIVHVFERPVRAVPGGGPWISAEEESVYGGEIGARLERAVDGVRSSVPAASGVLLRGRPHEAIARHVADTKADLVVVGARGLALALGTLFGSVADRVLRTSPSAVLVVPEGERAALLPKALVVPTDFSEAAASAVERSAALAHELGATLDVLHAWEPPNLGRHGGGIAEDIAGAVLVRVREAHPVGNGVVRHHAREGAPVPAILGLVDEVRADLIVIAATGRSRLSSLFLGGVTDRVVRASPIPVLVLRAT